MARENTLDNIFTDYDESIFSDGSIDPMGLRIIWTSIGSKIFHNKLNTISTDIKLYTLNLFHHYLLQKCASEEEDGVNKLIRKKPYFNKSDLFEGMVIFLENLLINATYNLGDSSLVVPGKNKLSNLKNNESKRNTIEKISVNRDKGILVRQYLLGIHGRHKGPFLQMGVFKQNEEDIYNNPEVWKEASEIFKSSPWKEAEIVLTELIKNKLLNFTIKANAFIEYKVEDVLTKSIEEKYVALLKKDIYVDEAIRSFWLNRLGLKEDTAGILYKAYLKQKVKGLNFQKIIVSAYSESNDPYLGAINAIEPLLTLIDKCINRILSSATSKIDDDLKEFIDHWLKNNEVDPGKITAYLSVDYINQEAINRLQKLLDIYINASQSDKSAENFIINLIKYHEDIMKTRGNLNWVSIGADNKIFVHRSIYISDPHLTYLKSMTWVNSYYLPTVDSLHKGLTNEAA
ncbi:hypothetical protein [Algoriphagus sp.]|uniref:hypothetical protein n=1 Tax=Algoriphagus sp. TaxID=1872435 RepID=UPI0039197552